MSVVLATEVYQEERQVPRVYLATEVYQEAPAAPRVYLANEVYQGKIPTRLTLEVKPL
mgnify:CR=1 FL=1